MFVRDPDDIRMCNCASCGIELLGESEREWSMSLGPIRSQYPPLVAGRVMGRPFCTGCIRVKKKRAAAGRSFGRHDGGDLSPWQENAIRDMEG